jgi:hypothetical protein
MFFFYEDGGIRRSSTCAKSKLWLKRYPVKGFIPFGIGGDVAVLPLRPSPICDVVGGNFSIKLISVNKLIRAVEYIL